MLKDGKLNFYWIQVNNNLQAAPNSSQRNLSRLPQSREFHRRLGRLSDRHRDGGRSHPAGSDVGRKGRRLRQRGAAHACLAPARQRAGRGALRSLAADGVLKALHHRRGVAGGDARPPIRTIAARHCSMFLFRNGRSTNSRSPKSRPEYENHESQIIRLLCPEGAVRGICRVRPRPRP